MKTQILNYQPLSTTNSPGDLWAQKEKALNVFSQGRTGGAESREIKARWPALPSGLAFLPLTHSKYAFGNERVDLRKKGVYRGGSG